MELGQIVAAVAAIYLASLSKNLRSLFVALLHAAAVSIKSPEKCTANGTLGNDSEVDYKNLLDDPRWIMVKNIALKDKALFYDKLRGEEEEF